MELTKQQAMTIRRLEKDSLAKSDRIADLETRYIAYWDHSQLFIVPIDNCSSSSAISKNEVRFSYSPLSIERALL